MKTRVLRRWVVGGLVGTAAFAASVGWAQFRFPPRNDSRGGVRELRASVDTDRTQYPSRRAVQIRLRLTNVSDRSIQFDTGNNREYDVTIRDARTGRAVWEWSRQPGAPRQERRTLRLEAGQSRTHRVLWDQTDYEGRRVRPGVYRIEARIYPQGPVSAEVYLGSGDRDDRDDEDRDWRRDRDRDGRLRPGDIPRPFPSPGADRSRNDASVRADLRLERSTYRPGDTIGMTYIVQNTGSRNKAFRFSSGRQFDVTAARSGRGGREVWRLSQDRMYTQALTGFELRPGERRTFTAAWRTDRDLDEGDYRITAFLTPLGERGGVATATGTVRVEDRDAQDRFRGLRRRSERDPGRDSLSLRLRDLLDSGRSHLGRRVRLSGMYRGWRGGEGGPPRRRGDWVLESEGHTLYITGPHPTTRVGETITVEGILRRTDDGRLYLETD